MLGECCARSLALARRLKSAARAGAGLWQKRHLYKDSHAPATTKARPPTSGRMPPISKVTRSTAAAIHSPPGLARSLARPARTSASSSPEKLPGSRPPTPRNAATHCAGGRAAKPDARQRVPTAQSRRAVGCGEGRGRQERGW